MSLVSLVNDKTTMITHDGQPLYPIIEQLRTSISHQVAVQKYGAIGDGVFHPLTERFTTLAAAQAVYPFVTSLSQGLDYAGIQATINATKDGGAVFLPAGRYIIDTQLNADYALSMYGEGGQGLIEVDPGVHGDSRVRGSVLYSRVSSGSCLSIKPTKYTFGGTLRDFAIWGVAGTCDKGLSMDGIGWMGILSGINIQKFPNQACAIGYIQDTYINNCSFLLSGNQTNPAITFSSDSNYVYFDGCHFELTPYIMKLANPWFLHFMNCHFEVARPTVAGTTAADRYVYSSACIDLGQAYKTSFVNCTFIPTDAGYLASKLGIDRSVVPYFMLGSGDYLTFVRNTVMAPGGSVDVGYFTGSHTNFHDNQFLDMNPSKWGLYVTRGIVSNNVIGIRQGDDPLRLYGCYVGGNFRGNVFGFTTTDTGVKRTSGALVSGACYCVDNEYPRSNTPFIFLDAVTSVNQLDGGAPQYMSVSSTQDIDLTRVHPATHIRVVSNGVNITHIYGAPQGRRVLVYTDGTGTILSYSSTNLLTAGAVNHGLGQYHATEFYCVNPGTLQQIGA